MIKLKREIKKNSISKTFFMHLYGSSKSNIQVYLPLIFKMYLEQNIIIASPGRHDIKAS
jgi:hypothetical protein